jgi:glycosyltransferase involved in cell wall biosynthesis
MNILILSYWYYPEPVAKPHDFAVELTKRGHRVTVITGYPNYPQGRLYEGYSMSRLRREWLDGVEVLRVPMLVNHSKSGILRVLSYLSFALSALLASKSLSYPPQVIWTYQVGLPGIALSKWMHVPLVHEVQDLWPEWSRKGQMGVGEIFYKLLDAQERFIYKNANSVTTISEGFKRALQEKGISGAKITVIPNWWNEQTASSPQQGALPIEDLAWEKHFNVVYGGNIGTAQALDVLLDAAENTRDLTDAQFILIGDGVDRERLERLARQKNLANVHFLGSKPLASMPCYLSHANALFIHLKNEPEYAITIPSKTYSYLAAGKPVIAAASGDVADLIASLGAGVICPPEDPDSLASSIRRLYACSSNKRDEMGRKGRESFLANYTRPVLVDRYESLFHQVLTGQS